MAALPRGDRVRTRGSRRISFALGVLLALAAAFAIAGAVVVLTADEDTPTQGAPNWSAWKPSGGGAAPSTQIADHVGREYRLGSKQLVLVTGGRPLVADIPLDPVLQPADGELTVVPGSSVLYRLCGLGPNCAINRGKASTNRHLLLRREGLELALYSFRYINGLKNAFVIMPPRPGSTDPGQALFFRRADFERQLEIPLAKTLGSRTPSVSSIRSASDSKRVDRLTSSRLYQYSISAAESDIRAFLVLSPLTSLAQGDADNAVSAIMADIS
jgi:hypothetical protein